KAHPSRYRTRTTRKVHVRVRFIRVMNVRDNGGCRSWTKKLNNARLGLYGRDGSQSFEHQPKTQHQFEQSHRRIEDVVVNDLVEVGKDQVNNSTKHAPCGCNQAEDRQSLRNVIRFEPQPGAYRRGQSKKRQPNIVIIETSSD